ncbi:MAG: hypothetical protein ABI307_12115 [Mycobacterium sp.]
MTGTSGTALPRLLSGGCGVSMAITAGAGMPGPAALAALLTAAAALAGLWLRPAATSAVMLAVLTIVLADPPPAPAAVSGLCAVAYLALRYCAVTAPTVIAAVGFAFVGLVAVAFPLRVAWLPVIAPLAVLGCYALAARPFLVERG